jgi:hypothetical protein
MRAQGALLKVSLISGDGPVGWVVIHCGENYGDKTHLLFVWNYVSRIPTVCVEVCE